SELKASVGAGAVRVRLFSADDRVRAAELLRAAFTAPVELEHDPLALSVRADDPEAVAQALIELFRAGVRGTDYEFGQPSLDEVFLALTGHKVDADHAPLANEEKENAA